MPTAQPYNYLTQTPLIKPNILPSESYLFSIAGYGGELVVGTVPNAIRDYGEKRGQKALSHHLFESGLGLHVDSENKQIASDYGKEPWYECDDLCHIDGVEIDSNPQIVIRHVDGQTIYKGRYKSKALQGQFKFQATPIPAVPPERSVFIARTREFRTMTFGLTFAGKFNLQKLRIETRNWLHTTVSDDLFYDDVEINMNLHSVHCSRQKDTLVKFIEK
jgi:hypothetical protein